MCNRCLLPALLLALGIGLVALPGSSASADDDAGRIAKLVKELGSSKFTVRDRAKRQLEALGTQALDALRRAAQSPDPETSRRAGEIVKRMEEKIALDNLLAPKKVRLNLKDTSVLEAVAELARQSGYRIEIQGDRAALAARKITLDTGETSFWQAYDALCRQAGLVENQNLYNPYGNGRLNPYLTVPQAIPMQPVNPLQIQPAPGRLNLLPAPAPALPPAALRRGVQLRQAGAAQAVVQIQVAPAQPAPALKVRPAQVQIQPAPVAPPMPPVRIQPRPTIRPLPAVLPNGQFNLVAGKPAELPTHYAGAVRVRALAGQPQVLGVPAPAKRSGEATLTLEVMPEPRLQNFQLLGSVQVDRAVDDQGQQLTVPMDPMPEGGPVVVPNGLNGRVWVNGRVVYAYNPNANAARFAQVRLKLGDKKATRLKELSGQVTAQMLAPPQALITVKDVLKSAGKKVPGDGGGSIEVLTAQKQADGSYLVKFRMETPPAFMPAPFQGVLMPGVGNGGQVRIQIQVGAGGRVVQRTVNTHGLPTLVDAKGRSFQLAQPPQRIYQAGLGVMAQEITMVFRPHAEQGEPDRLVLHGQRNISVPIPFTLRDVPLP